MHRAGLAALLLAVAALPAALACSPLKETWFRYPPTKGEYSNGIDFCADFTCVGDVSVTFLKLDIEDRTLCESTGTPTKNCHACTSPSCLCDSVTVTYGDQTGSLRFCGTRLPGNFTVPGPVRFSFRSDDSYAFDGFEVVLACRPLAAPAAPTPPTATATLAATPTPSALGCSCSTKELCHKAVCGDKGCEVLPTSGAACDDGDPNTVDDKCYSGRCIGHRPCQVNADCQSDKLCQGAMCGAHGMCTYKLAPDGTPCGTGRFCHSGWCKFVTPVPPVTPSPSPTATPSPPASPRDDTEPTPPTPIAVERALPPVPVVPPFVAKTTDVLPAPPHVLRDTSASSTAWIGATVGSLAAIAVFVIAYIKIAQRLQTREAKLRVPVVDDKAADKIEEWKYDDAGSNQAPPP